MLNRDCAHRKHDAPGRCWSRAFQPRVKDTNQIARNFNLGVNVQEGTIHSEERQQMVVGVHPMRRCDLLAPFQTEGLFEGLGVESGDLASVADGAWAQYERDGDAGALATKNALFFRSVFVPSLALSIADTQDGERRRVFADRFTDVLKKRLSLQPAPLHSFVHTLVLSKSNSPSMRDAETRNGTR
jgi:hypothetical protein